MPTAIQLKDEGNALFLAGKYAEARVKYTEAIALDGSNAILFTNKATTLLKLKQSIYAPQYIQTAWYRQLAAGVRDARGWRSDHVRRHAGTSVRRSGT